MSRRRWVAKAQRCVADAAAIAEEIAHTTSREDSRREILVRGAKPLGLDVVAFDYSRTQGGELVVFEPTPFATLWAPFNVHTRYDYRRPCVERLYATPCAYWLERSGLVSGAVSERRAGAAAQPSSGR